jgi:hypothetical protein
MPTTAKTFRASEELLDWLENKAKTAGLYTATIISILLADLKQKDEKGIDITPDILKENEINLST